jgi:hypothetical protein
MDATGGSVITAFDYVWNRLAGRLAGMGDEEYFWEPVPGCWSLRQRHDGRWRLDGRGGGGPAPDPAPFTTIAWRLGHLAGIAVGGFTSWRFGDRRLDKDTLDCPSGVEGIAGFLDEQYRPWRDGLAGLGPQEWAAPLGSSWGQYAGTNTVDLALHVLDEVIHHSAEIGVLRDLYAQRAALRG